MSLYFTLLFALLTTQMAILFVLVLPLPNKMRKMCYNMWEIASMKQEFKVIIVMLNILVGLLFVDSWKRAHVPIRHKGVNDLDSTLSMQGLASRAYNQRNVYISGFILYFMAGIPTVLSIVRRLIKYQDLINEKTKKGSSKEAALVSDDKEIAKLQEELRKKDVSLEGLKKQIENLENFYDESNKPKAVTNEEIKQSKRNQ
ncbi:hypothetical protein KAFR_0F02040 [Kazachstania africana CBS 2517]|uniref:Endoplasmic reticulum transmembrane protein n=1 Tax=Kazachstania africana (strain ATCC 22294 / BCRC 22015 / CBS 2517 / CECT 1963 / NBRC 1671 / NRRL Y-8276) TaxID=1071382 RepID=H2AWQ1_KAZAF|nr:hypothetical protein KAFR_0F02040 [Kazachstania africana CBS 2517]CCF58801.1 hypothetical protein KAFR_0F02040 [Kazachstania africana CBS 2517]